jgi:hypothetical protein
MRKVGAVTANLIPLMIAAAVVPIWIVIVLLMLTNKGGVAKAAAFVFGTVLVRLAHGILFGFVFRREAEVDGAAGANAVTSVLMLVIGLLLLILAYKKWAKEVDPDTPPPKWMSALGSMGTLKAFGLGALLMAVGFKHLVFTLSALATIIEAQLGQAQSILLFLVYLLGAISLLLIPIIFSAVAPERAGRTLESARRWLERNDRPVSVIVSLVFGAYFAFQGITGLLG